jgi:hypothetical protein
VRTEEQRIEPSWPGTSAAAEWAAYLCLAPLLLGLAGVALLPEPDQRELAQRATIAWGAALLAFGGAVHWGLALAGRLPWRPLRIGGALFPAVLAAAGVLVGGQRGLAVLAVGSGLFWLYEHRSLGAQLPAPYLALRRQLAGASCLLLAVTMLVSDAAGLR